MKSGTSYFNWTVFKKDLTRFAPAWAIATVSLLLMLHGVIGGGRPEEVSSFLAEMTGPVTIFGFCYALLTAQLLFGDLFAPRMCNALHAMPLRRENWFLTHVTAGLVFDLIPMMALLLTFLPRLGQYAMTAVFLFGAGFLAYFYFFSTAVLCVFCTGNRFAMALFYGLFSFFPLLINWFGTVIYEPLLDGVIFPTGWIDKATPVVNLAMSHLIAWDPAGDGIEPQMIPGDGWTVLWIMTAAAVAIYGLALLLYRRRQLERAGDFVAVRPLAPVFLVLYTLTAGAVFQLFHDIFTGGSYGTIFLTVGILLGFLTGLMLLQRTTRVFRPRNLAALALMLAVLWGSMGLTRLDPMGITRWIPEEGEVESVSIRNAVYARYPDAPDIGQAIQFHQQILENRDREMKAEDIRSQVFIRYQMKDGSEVQRRYDISREGPEARWLKDYFSAPEIVLEYEDWETFRRSVTGISVIRDDDLFLEGEQARRLLDAVKKDCEAGVMCQIWDYNPDRADYIGEIQIYRIDPDGQDSGRYLTLSADCTNTLAYLEQIENP